jgi:hypothetical protein
MTVDDSATPDLSELSADDRVLLAAQWSDMAHGAHANVAIYSALSLQLMALGVGPELLLAVHQAAIDEVERSQHSSRLASAYAAMPIEPSVPPVPDALDADPVALAVAIFAHGCVAAAYDAALANAALAEARDAAVVEVLRAMARDRAAHADMARSVVALCAGEEPDAVRAALEATPVACAIAPTWQAAPSAQARAHGALSRDDQARIADAAIESERAAVLSGG